MSKNQVGSQGVSNGAPSPGGRRDCSGDTPEELASKRLVGDDENIEGLGHR